MKKKTAITLATLAVAAVAVVSLCSFTSSNQIVTDEGHHTHLSCQGKHCTGTVGCSCSGFSAITNGKEWQKSYCKNCGHHKSYHK